MNPIIKSETNRTPIDKVSIVTNETSTGATFKPQQSKQPSSTSTPALSLRQNLIDEAHTPRVTSDNKTLRISTMQFPVCNRWRIVPPARWLTSLHWHQLILTMLLMTRVMWRVSPHIKGIQYRFEV